jgi:hypothetical protein
LSASCGVTDGGVCAPCSGMPDGLLSPRDAGSTGEVTGVLLKGVVGVGLGVNRSLGSTVLPGPPGPSTPSDGTLVPSPGMPIGKLRDGCVGASTGFITCGEAEGRITGGASE